MQPINLEIFDHLVRIDCNIPEARELVVACYSAFIVRQPRRRSSLNLQITRDSKPNDWVLVCGDSLTACANSADLAYFLEKDMTIALQKLRSDLYFVHGAAIDVLHRCTIVVGESGIGKSTLSWELCNRGFAYMSDELAPIDPASKTVKPYPHAICLKREPDTPLAQPDQSLRTSATLHIPVESIPSLIQKEPSTLHNIVFLTQAEADSSGEAIPIQHSEAAARLYANGLNQLAHTNDGLSVAAQIVTQTKCFLVVRTNIKATCDAVEQILT